MLEGLRLHDLAAKVGYTEPMTLKIEANHVVPSITISQKIIVALDGDMPSLSVWNLTPQAEATAERRNVTRGAAAASSMKGWCRPAEDNLLEGNGHDIRAADAGSAFVPLRDLFMSVT
jgi:DNA-binding XRE family transcriptional regulator